MRTPLRAAVLTASATLLLAGTAGPAMAAPAGPQEKAVVNCASPQPVAEIGPGATSATVRATLRCTALGLTLAEVPVVMTATGRNCKMPQAGVSVDPVTRKVKVTAAFACDASAEGKNTTSLSAPVMAAGRQAAKLSLTANAHAAATRANRQADEAEAEAEADTSLRSELLDLGTEARGKVSADEGGGAAEAELGAE